MPPQRWARREGNRFVGIFYFLTHEMGIPPKTRRGIYPYDVARILAEDPEALKKPDSPLWGKIPARAIIGGEPIYVGTTAAPIPWVLRRRMRELLFLDAGVDVLIFDTTNAQTYPEVYPGAVREVFRQVRQAGGRTPQIAFMVNTQAGQTAQQLYDDLYKPGLYRELWFNWLGKPLMICDPQDASPELQQFFTLRRAHWPFTLTNTPYAWHWEATYPQPYGFEPTGTRQVLGTGERFES